MTFLSCRTGATHKLGSDKYKEKGKNSLKIKLKNKLIDKWQDKSEKANSEIGITVDTKNKGLYRRNEA